MLPQVYELPVAIVIVIGGAVACFAGYRMFRVVLGIYGFILGAMLASSMMGITNATGMIVAAVAGGVAGAIVLFFAYFVGVAIIGAGLGALVVHLVWLQMKAPDPPAQAIILGSAVGAASALLLRRYVIIVGTAFGGAWTMIVGGLAISVGRASWNALTADDVWILYPFTPPTGQRWMTVAWVALGVLGTLLQMASTGPRRKR